MAFAQPMALLFFLLFIPVLLLYLLKQRRRRVQVSTLMFWDQILRDEQTVASFTRLRKLLSLLLQLLFITLLALALARPVLSKDLLGARRVVLLLDTSASMAVRESDGTRFDEAKRIARDVIHGVRSGDSMMLLTVAQEPNIAVPFTDSRRVLLEALNRIELTHATGRLEGVVELLRNLPPDSRTTCVYFISDGAFEPVEANLPPEMQWAYLRIGLEAENVGITSFELRRLPASPQDFEVWFEVTNETAREVRVPYELRVGGDLLDAGEIELPPGERGTKSIRQFTEEGGEVSLALDYRDAFPLDNRAYAVLRPSDPIPVVLVTGGNLFLESALATDGDIALRTIAPGEYPLKSVDDPNDTIYVFDRWSPPEVPNHDAIYIAAWPPQLGIAIAGELTNPIVTDWAQDHAITRHLQLSDLALERALKVSPPEGCETLVRSFDDPLIVVVGGTARRSLIVAFDPTVSDLPLRVAFPVLVGNAIRYFAEEGVEDGVHGPSMGHVLSPDEIVSYVPRQVTANGATVTRVLRPGEPASEDFASSEKGSLLRPVPIDRVGIYAAQLSDRTTIPLFATNLNSRLESRIGPGEGSPIKTREPLPTIREGARFASEPWLPLVVSALALLLLEWVSFHRRWVE